MESLCEENLNDSRTNLLHTRTQTEPNAGSNSNINVDICEMEMNEVIAEENNNETNVSDVVCVSNVSKKFISSHTNNAETDGFEGVVSVNTVSDHIDNVQTDGFEELVSVSTVFDHTNNVQTDSSEGDKIMDENAALGGEIEIISDSSNQNDIIEIEYDFKHIPYQITGSWKEFSSTTRNNFTRGCKWAPDGSCILTCSEDNCLKIFNLPHQLWDYSQWQDISEMEAVVRISEGELIYDYCWYPLMNSSDASTCCLASASRNSTVHLWDGFTGELRCSYRTYNHMDEIVTPHSLSFDADGQKLFCGFEKVIRVFNVDSPGRKFEERHIFAKRSGQSGIVSCFAFTSADRNISAAGSYQRTIGIYSEPSGNLECLLEGQKGGITQLQFSPDGTFLYSGGRKDPEILCWDIRNLGSVVFSLRRSCATNQRMYFDISRCGRYVVSGNHNGVIAVWDVTKEPKIISEEEFAVLEPIQFFLAHDDCVNGISLHPTFPLLCSSSGQRKYPTLLSDDDDGIFSPKIDKRDNSLRLWWLGKNN